MHLPLSDWQFYVVSILALWGAWMVARPFLPSKKRAGGGCPSCASGSAASVKKRKTPLTIGGKRV